MESGESGVVGIPKMCRIHASRGAYFKFVAYTSCRLAVSYMKPHVSLATHKDIHIAIVYSFQYMCYLVCHCMDAFSTYLSHFVQCRQDEQHFPWYVSKHPWARNQEESLERKGECFTRTTLACRMKFLPDTRQPQTIAETEIYLLNVPLIQQMCLQLILQYMWKNCLWNTLITIWTTPVTLMMTRMHRRRLER